MIKKDQNCILYAFINEVSTKMDVAKQFVSSLVSVNDKSISFSWQPLRFTKISIYSGSVQ